VRKADNLPPLCAVVTKSGNLNFLEPSGPLRACNGTAFFFYNVITEFKCTLIFISFSMSSCVFEMVNPIPMSHSVELAHYSVRKWSRG